MRIPLTRIIKFSHLRWKISILLFVFSQSLTYGPGENFEISRGFRKIRPEAKFRCIGHRSKRLGKLCGVSWMSDESKSQGSAKRIDLSKNSSRPGRGKVNWVKRVFNTFPLSISYPHANQNNVITKFSHLKRNNWNFYLGLVWSNIENDC